MYILYVNIRLLDFMCTCVPPFQPPHVNVPVHSKEHDTREYNHAEYPKEAHQETVYGVEEEENVGQDVVQPPVYEHQEKE